MIRQDPPQGWLRVRRADGDAAGELVQFAGWVGLVQALRDVVVTDVGVSLCEPRQPPPVAPGS